MSEITLKDFDLRAPGRGFLMRGWDFSSDEIQAALNENRMLNPAVELFSNVCPWNCDFCFTESPTRTGRKLSLPGEMTLDERFELLEQLRQAGAKSVNIVGAGEPTIDPYFWHLMERVAELGMTPILYTEASLKLRGVGFAKRLFDLGATVVVKVNSLFDRQYQNRVVRGQLDSKDAQSYDYFEARNRALDTLLEVGFANEEPTRLALDTIICRQNLSEVPNIHRWARERNIFVLFVNYLPAGRSEGGMTDEISLEEQAGVFRELADIDSKEFGLSHSHQYPYAGGVPCTIRGLGIYVKIQGEVFDCPGERERLGSFPSDSIGQIWQRAESITREFDGGCRPRLDYWSSHALSV